MTKNKMWGGRFENNQHEFMLAINQSISFDKELWSEDIAGSIAHVTMLAAVEIVTETESLQIIEGLKTIEKEILGGNFTFKSELEDIHMNIESRLTELIGDVAGKLHTARSRNDQVATDLKLYTMKKMKEVDELLDNLRQALITKAEKHINIIMPGFTHLQVAQPLLFSHHLLAYVEMFGRDRQRTRDAIARMNESPLGAAALAGTSYKIDREMTAKLLGFGCAMANSIDAVSDRDFVIEAISVAAIIAVHLSRLGEEIVLWMSSGFNFIKLPDFLVSGSSIMPQKKNPDAAELVRAKSGRVFGSLMAILTIMKGLPLAYSKDMQEDKEQLFDAMHNLNLGLRVMILMIQNLEPVPEKMQQMAMTGFSTATDLADIMVQKFNMPFRQAHHATAKLVALAEKKGLSLWELSLNDIQASLPSLNKNFAQFLTIERSVASRTSFGGTSPERVKEAILKLKN